MFWIVRPVDICSFHVFFCVCVCVCCFLVFSLRPAYSWLSFLTLVKKFGENFWLWQTSPLLIRLIFTTVNLGFSHIESGNQDTSRLVLKNRDIQIKLGWVSGLQIDEVWSPKLTIIVVQVVKSNEILSDQRNLLTWEKLSLAERRLYIKGTLLLKVLKKCYKLQSASIKTQEMKYLGLDLKLIL